MGAIIEQAVDVRVAFVYECRRCRRQYCVGSASPDEAGKALGFYVKGELLSFVGRKVHDCDDGGRGLAEVIGHTAPVRAGAVGGEVGLVMT